MREYWNGVDNMDGNYRGEEQWGITEKNVG